MLEGYLNQTCTFLRRTADTDARGQPVYGKSAEVPCRLQEKYQLIQTAKGETVPASHICYLKDEVSVGDKINGMTVHAVNSWVSLEGEVIGFRAVM